MHHAEFVDKCRSGKLGIEVDKTLPLRAAQAGVLPPAYRSAQNRYLVAGFVALVLAGVMAMVAWWAGLLAMLVPLGLLYALRSGAAATTRNLLIEDEAFYQFAQFHQLLRLIERP